MSNKFKFQNVTAGKVNNILDVNVLRLWESQIPLINKVNKPCNLATGSPLNSHSLEACHPLIAEGKTKVIVKF